MADNLLVHKLFEKAAQANPQKIALQIKRDEQWFRYSYADIKSGAESIAVFLLKEGLAGQERVGIILENRPEWAMIYLGIMYAGLTAVPFDIQLNAQELKNLSSDSGIRVLFCSYNIFRDKVTPKGLGDSGYFSAKNSRCPYFVILDGPELKQQNIVNFSEIKNIAADTFSFPQVSEEGIASLIYTSGTTAKPKGVLLTHRNFCANFKSIEVLKICTPSENILSILPLHHTYAFMVTLLLPLFLGAKVTYCYSFKPQDLSAIIKEAQVTLLVGVPQLFSMMHKAIFEQAKHIPAFILPFLTPVIRAKVRQKFGRSLRLFASGGARLEPKVANDLFKLLRIKIVEGYGLTETSPVVSLNPPQKIKFGSVGKPVPAVEVRILNPDANGVGQVLIKGPNVMKGYFNQPQLTSEVIKEGWFYSGDLGYLDKEGYLFLTGREKDVIVLASGKNIYPDELEEYYSKSPYIKEMCIFAKSEEKFGRRSESLYAVVVPNLDYFKERNESDIRGKVRWEFENLGKHLPSYNHIMGFIITKEDLPRTALKKLKRYEVRQKYLQEMPQKPAVKEAQFTEEELKSLNPDVARKVINYISGQIKKPVTLESHLEIDLGIDSLSRVELGLGLESLFGISIPEEAFYKISTVKEVILSIMEITGKAAVTAVPAQPAQKSWREILKEEPRQQILKKIKIHPGPVDILFSFIFRYIFLIIFKLFWLLRARGRKNLPAKGPYLVCSNHASYLDAFVIFTGLKLRQGMNIFFLGHAAIFEHPFVSWAIKVARLIPIDPNVHLTDAMQAVAYVIGRGKSVCIFPEGRRSIDENVGEFKKGVGILIKELDIPVVPVYIKGSHHSWPRGNLLPKPYPLKVIFGPALSLKELQAKAKAESYEALAEALREEVVKLAC